jgi:transcription elongation factor GreB
VVRIVRKTEEQQQRHTMKTPLITREGYEKLKKEMDYLWREERPEVTKKVTWAASLGDRSENADYQYNKKRLREIDRRVRYLTKCLENLKIVDYSPQQEGKVFFGAWVEIENDDGDTLRFRIVGYDEIFGRKDYISIDSPMARALLKKEVGDLAVVQTPPVKPAGTSMRSSTLNSPRALPGWHFAVSARITIP